MVSLSESIFVLITIYQSSCFAEANELRVRNNEDRRLLSCPAIPTQNVEREFYETLPFDTGLIGEYEFYLELESKAPLSGVNVYSRNGASTTEALYPVSLLSPPQILNSFQRTNVYQMKFVAFNIDPTSNVLQIRPTTMQSMELNATDVSLLSNRVRCKSLYEVPYILQPNESNFIENAFIKITKTNGDTVNNEDKWQMEESIKRLYNNVMFLECDSWCRRIDDVHIVLPIQEEQQLDGRNPINKTALLQLHGQCKNCPIDEEFTFFDNNAFRRQLFAKITKNLDIHLSMPIGASRSRDLQEPDTCTCGPDSGGPLEPVSLSEPELMQKFNDAFGINQGIQLKSKFLDVDDCEYDTASNDECIALLISGEADLSSNQELEAALEASVNILREDSCSLFLENVKVKSKSTNEIQFDITSIQQTPTSDLLRMIDSETILTQFNHIASERGYPVSAIKASGQCYQGGGSKSRPPKYQAGTSQNRPETLTPQQTPVVEIPCSGPNELYESIYVDVQQGGGDRGNHQLITDSQTGILETAIKETYNTIAFEGCDPYFRRIEQARLIISSNGSGSRNSNGQAPHESLPSVFVLVGQCQNCPVDDFSLFDDDTIGRRLTESLSKKNIQVNIPSQNSKAIFTTPSQSRSLRLSEYDPNDRSHTCTCPEAADRDDPPSLRELEMLEEVNNQIVGITDEDGNEIQLSMYASQATEKCVSPGTRNECLKMTIAGARQGSVPGDSVLQAMLKATVNSHGMSSKSSSCPLRADSVAVRDRKTEENGNANALLLEVDVISSQSVPTLSILERIDKNSFLDQFNHISTNMGYSITAKSIINDGQCGEEYSASIAKPPVNRIIEKNGAGVRGDPHLKLWSGDLYDFHGICDLVLLQNPAFRNALGMDIHIRTKKTRRWSYVEAAVLRIATDTFEVRHQQSWFNNEPISNLSENQINQEVVLLPKLAGLFTIQFKKIHNQQEQFVIKLNREGTERIVIKTWNDMVRFDIYGATPEDFSSSVGLMGSFPNGIRIGRDHHTVYDNNNAFGNEWQVLMSEPKLFHNREGPQAPSQCEVPTKYALRRRLAETDITHEDAQVACKRLKEQSKEEEYDQCIFDVIATGNADIVNAYL